MADALVVPVVAVAVAAIVVVVVVVVATILTVAGSLCVATTRLCVASAPGPPPFCTSRSATSRPTILVILGLSVVLVASASGGQELVILVDVPSI